MTYHTIGLLSSTLAFFGPSDNRNRRPIYKLPFLAISTARKTALALFSLS
jgi:hypothetical protein